jgi:AraC-like DNA-binding protein
MGSKGAALERAKQAIEADPSLPHRLGDLADLTHYTLWHFQRLFTARYGITPGRYVRRARLRLACHLIETTDWGMARITREIGYESQPAFSHVFTRVVGCAPTAYRRWARYAAELGSPERP